MNILANCYELLNAKEGLEKVMGDIMRVLYLYRSLWLPEIKSEVESLVTTLGETPYSSREINEAIKQLISLGLVFVREGIKASLRDEGQQSILLTININDECVQHLLEDERLQRYQYARVRALRRPFD